MARETVHSLDQVAGDPEHGIVKPAANGNDTPSAPVLADADDVARDAPGLVSPEQFYREATQREDVRRIIDALAK